MRIALRKISWRLAGENMHVAGSSRVRRGRDTSRDSRGMSRAKTESLPGAGIDLAGSSLEPRGRDLHFAGCSLDLAAASGATSDFGKTRRDGFSLFFWAFPLGLLLGFISA